MYAGGERGIVCDVEGSLENEMECQLCSAVVTRSMETLGRGSVDCAWEMWSRNGFNSELTTSNS